MIARLLGFASLLLLTACAAMKPTPQFDNLSVSINTVEGQVAERTLYASGRVSGSHLSGNRSAPILSMGSEEARPEDLTEIASLVARLPAPVPLPELSGTPHVKLYVTFKDESVVTYARTSKEAFSDPALQRLEAIIYSYRAGHW